MLRKRLSLLSLLGGFIILFIIGPLIFRSKFPLPSLWNIISEIINNSESADILPAIGLTFVHFIASLIIGIIGGLVLGIIQIQSPIANSIISPWITIFRITPAVVWISVLLIITFFPNGAISVTIGSIFTACYISLPVKQALANISEEEQTYIFAQKVNNDINWKVGYCYLPRIIVAVSSGIGLGGSISLIIVIVAEALSGQKGTLGFLLVNYQKMFNSELLWTVVILVAVLAIIFFSFFRSIEKLTGVMAK